jgi:hypothetical protein
MNKKTFGSFLGALAGIAAAIIAAKQPHHVPSLPVIVPTVPTYTLVVHACKGDCTLDHKIPGATVTILDRTVTTDGAGNAAFADLKADRYRVCANADGYKEFCDDNHGVPADGDVYLALERNVPPVVALHTDGSAVFRTPDGSAWRWRFVTAFRLAQRWAAGENVEPFLRWTQDVGANGVRVLLQFAGGPNTIGLDGRALRPDALSPSQVAAFATLLEAHGLYVELTVLADCDQLGLGHAAQRARVDAVVRAVTGHPNVFMELANEPFKNGADVERLAHELGYDRSRPVLMATGSYDLIGNPHTLVLDYLTNHSERKPDWPGEAGKTGHFIGDGWDADEHNAGWHGFKGPAIEDEPIGAQEAPNPNLGRRDNRVEAFEDGGAGFGLGSGGATFHCDDCVQTVVPGPVQTACARAFFSGMSAFPPDSPTGRYAHDGFRDHPLASIAGLPADQNAVEVAARVFGDRAYAVAAQPGPRYVPCHKTAGGSCGGTSGGTS